MESSSLRRSEGSFRSSSSSHRKQSKEEKRRLHDAHEAEVLSQATSQAITAARSILMSGGTESTALSTARAAAQSILVPYAGDPEKVAPSLSFLGRRKARRQADIVASMALLSVKNSLSGTGGSHAEDVAAALLLDGHNLPPQMIEEQGSYRVPSSLDSNSFRQEPAAAAAAAPPPSPRRSRFSPRRAGGARPPLSPRKSTQTPVPEAPPSPRIIDLTARRSPVKSDGSLKSGIPSTMPMPRSKARDSGIITDDIDPIYDARPTYSTRGESTNLMLYSYSSDSQGDSLTYGDSTYPGDYSTVVGSETNILTAFAKALGCGCAPPPPRPVSLGIVESRSDHSDTVDYENDHRDTGRDDPDVVYQDERVKVRLRQADSGSSADSAEILRELNLSESREVTKRRASEVRDRLKHLKAQRGKRESMEQVVLRALSNSSKNESTQPQRYDRMDRVSMERNVFDQDSAFARSTMSNGSTRKKLTSIESSSPSNGKQSVSSPGRKEKFKQWVRLRKKNATGGEAE